MNTKADFSYSKSPKPESQKEKEKGKKPRVWEGGSVNAKELDFSKPNINGNTEEQSVPDEDLLALVRGCVRVRRSAGAKNTHVRVTHIALHLGFEYTIEVPIHS